MSLSEITEIFILVSEAVILLTNGKLNLNALIPAVIFFIILSLIYRAIVTRKYYN